jgi:hypothetical protein
MSIASQIDCPYIMVSVSNFCEADSKKVKAPNVITVILLTENAAYKNIPKKAWNETAKYEVIGECGLTLSLTISTILKAFMSAGQTLDAFDAIKLISKIDIPPTRIPVNGDPTACIKPPNPHSLSAQSAVKRSITNLLSFSENTLKNNTYAN